MLCRYAEEIFMIAERRCDIILQEEILLINY